MGRAWFGLAAVLAAGVAAGAGGEPARSSPTSQAAPATCGSHGIDVTVALAYEINTLGPIAAAYLELAYEPPLDLPPTAEKLRPRLTGLLPQGARIGAPTRNGKRLRVALTTTEQGIQPAKAFTMRFDCPAGSRVRPGSLSCATAEVVSASGQPMDAALAREVRCVVVGLDPARR